MVGCAFIVEMKNMPCCKCSKKKTAEKKGVKKKGSKKKKR